MNDEIIQDMPESVGQVEIIRKIGEGGMGSVYLGKHRTLDIALAVKLLPKHIDLKDPEYSQRFSREAKIAARLRHPNMVQVYDYGAEDGYYYLVMTMLTAPRASRKSSGWANSTGRRPSRSASKRRTAWNTQTPRA